MKMRWPAFLKAFGQSVVDWYDAWLDMTVIGIVWLLAQLTIVLGPPATFGVYYVAYHMIRNGESLGVKGMIVGARKYFLKGLAWGAINWLVAVITVTNFWFYSNLESEVGIVVRFVVLVLAGLWLMTQFYTVPFFMAQEQERVLLAIKNAFFLAMATLPYTLGLMIFVILDIGLSSVLILPAFLGLPMLIPVMATRTLFDRLGALGLVKKDPDPREV
jgi:uncharacterized membrane protein YesL